MAVAGVPQSPSEACTSRALPDFNTIFAVPLPPSHKWNKTLMPLDIDCNIIRVTTRFSTTCISPQANGFVLIFVFLIGLLVPEATVSSKCAWSHGWLVVKYRDFIPF